MNRIDKARLFNEKIKANLSATIGLIRMDELSDEEIFELIDLYPEFKIDTGYRLNDIIKYQNNLYKVVQSHTSQQQWTPDSNPSLYLKVSPEGTIPRWVQPTGAHNAYNIGDKVLFTGKIYESIMNSNTYSPTAYPQGWKIIE